MFVVVFTKAIRWGHATSVHGLSHSFFNTHINITLPIRPWPFKRFLHSSYLSRISYASLHSDVCYMSCLPHLPDISKQACVVVFKLVCDMYQVRILDTAYPQKDSSYSAYPGEWRYDAFKKATTGSFHIIPSVLNFNRRNTESVVQISSLNNHTSES
jgi:hypothetical protein